MILPPVRVVRCQPKTHPCPHCGQRGRRKRRLCRRIRSLAYRQVAFLDVHYAEYQARCGCCQSFRSWPLDVPQKADYDEAVRQAVLDRILDDGLNVQRTRAAMKRDFLLELSERFIYACLRWKVAQLDLPAHRQMVIEKFARDVQRLFEKGARVQTLWKRWHALGRNEKYQGLPELVAALALVEAGKFTKAVAFVYSEVAQRVRTNNHVERTNRGFRFAEKLRYKWRSRKWVVRFVLLALDRCWSQLEQPGARGEVHPAASAGQPRSPSAS